VRVTRHERVRVSSRTAPTRRNFSKRAHRPLPAPRWKIDEPCRLLSGIGNVRQHRYAAAAHQPVPASCDRGGIRALAPARDRAGRPRSLSHRFRAGFAAHAASSPSRLPRIRAKKPHREALLLQQRAVDQCDGLWMPRRRSRLGRFGARSHDRKFHCRPWSSRVATVCAVCHRCSGKSSCQRAAGSASAEVHDLP